MHNIAILFLKKSFKKWASFEKLKIVEARMRNGLENRSLAFMKLSDRNERTIYVQKERDAIPVNGFH